MVENLKIGDKVWILKLPYSASTSCKSMQASMPKAYKGKVEFIFDDTNIMIDINGFKFTRAKNCLFKTKKELIDKI